MTGKLSHLLAAGLLAAAICGADAATSRPAAKKLHKGSGKFLWFSDVHYDPYYGSKDGYKGDRACRPEAVADYPYGLVGCDAPWDLIHSTFKVRCTTMVFKSSGLGLSDFHTLLPFNYC